MQNFKKFCDVFYNSTPNNEKNKIIRNHSFFYISETFDFNQNFNIIQDIKEAKVIIINYFTDNTLNDAFFIISYQKNLLLINHNSELILKSLLSNNLLAEIYFLSNSKDIFIQKNITIPNPQKISDKIFNEEITNFCYKLYITPPLNKEIRSTIAGCLIKQGYLNTQSGEKINFSEKVNYESISQFWEEDDFINLREIGSGSSYKTYLIYHIEKEKLFAIKYPYGNSKEVMQKLLNREYQNYTNFNHPHLPKLYGRTKNTNYPIIEFINGVTLVQIEKIQLSNDDRILIILQIAEIIYYFTENNFVYRDLKPDNVMIDQNKKIYIIDFDRMVKYSDSSDHTTDFNSDFVDPQLYTGHISFKNDIFSLGKMIKYIMSDNNPEKNELTKQQKSFFNEIYRKCTDSKIENRYSIYDVIGSLFVHFSHIISMSSIVIDPHILTFIGLFYVKQNRNDIAIYYLQLAADQNFYRAQYTLGVIYSDSKNKEFDINKAIYYYTLSAEQNYVEAQNNLGSIYYKNKYIDRNINKAIYYFTLAANQNSIAAQCNLGNIYITGDYIKQDVNKAIYYLTLAAKQNDSESQFILGCIYCNKTYGKFNFNIAINYYIQAANNNNKNAQYSLGLIYFDNKYVTRDIKKSVYYFHLAANQNHPNAQNFLGFIYQNKEFQIYDIKKSIYYFQLAANQNNIEAIYNLGLIYLIQQDIKKAIYYFTQAANQNHVDAQYNLGMIFLDGKYVKPNINKGIQLLTSAANHGDANAQHNLGTFYYEGKTVERNVQKAIYYYSLSAQQKHITAYYNLGMIFYEGYYVIKDVYKAIHYFELAANQNHKASLFNLGCIYFDNIDVPRDINKSLRYFSLAAKLNHGDSLFNLGVIYSEGMHVQKNMNKAIYYYKLAAKQNVSRALVNLGNLYCDGIYVSRDIKKFIYYYEFAARKNDSKAQFFLGFFYITGNYVEKNISRGLNYLNLSANNRYVKAHFTLGYIYNDYNFGIVDINKSIHHYKEGSSFNHQYSKNNLGVIYKNGFSDQIQKNIALSIVYFTEAINQKNDMVSMYNLAHIYIFEDKSKEKINEAIHLLIKSSNEGFTNANILLCIALLLNYDLDFSRIYSIVNEKIDNPNLKFEIVKSIKEQKLCDGIIFANLYENMKFIDFVYNIYQIAIPSYNLINHKNNRIKSINSDFYEGFDITI